MMDFIHSKDNIRVFNDKKQVIAEVTFPNVDDNTVNVNHTYVDDSLRGQGISGQLMLELADELRKQQKKAVLTCSYAVNWFGKHRDDYEDILE